MSQIVTPKPRRIRLLSGKYEPIDNPKPPKAKRVYRTVAMRKQRYKSVGQGKRPHSPSNEVIAEIKGFMEELRKRQVPSCHIPRKAMKAFPGYTIWQMRRLATEKTGKKVLPSIRPEKLNLLLELAFEGIAQVSSPVVM